MVFDDPRAVAWRIGELRLSSKDIVNTWPSERAEILAAIRRARAIGQNVADQLDPRAPRKSDDQ